MDKETYKALYNIIERVKEENRYADMGDVEGEGMTVLNNIALVEAYMTTVKPEGVDF